MGSVHPDGEIIRKLRRKRNLSQDAVAALSRELGKGFTPISDRTVRSAERGVRVNEKSIKSIAAVLEVEPGCLIIRAPAVNPFPGLLPFGISEQSLFGGRADMTDSGVSILRERGALFVVGPSGSGKSSLCLSGVVPQFIANTPDSLLVIVRPSRSACRALAHALSEKLETNGSLEDTVRATEQFAVSFGRNEHALVDVLKAATARGVMSETLIYVDQVEQLCTLAEDAEAFLRLLANALDAPELITRCIVSIRDEYSGRFLHIDASFSARLAGTELMMRRMTKDELRDAIERPLKGCKLPYEASLVEMIVRDCDGEPGYLPHLQFLMQSLWAVARPEKERLTLAAYRDIGGLTGVIARHASAVYRSLAEPEKALARFVLPRLISTETGMRDISRARPINEFSEQARTLLRKLSMGDARIVSIGKDAAGTAVAEFTHEEVIRQWPELREWLDEDTATARVSQRLTRDIDHWIEAGESADYLVPRGRKLDEYDHLLATLPEQALPPRAAEFIDSSKEAYRWFGREARMATVPLALLLAAFIGYGPIKGWIDRERRDRAASAVAALSAAKDEADFRSQTIFFPDEEGGRFAGYGEMIEALAGLYNPEVEERAIDTMLAACEPLSDSTLSMLSISSLDLGAYTERCGPPSLNDFTARHMALTNLKMPDRTSLIRARFIGSLVNRIDFGAADLSGAEFVCSTMEGSDFSRTTGFTPLQYAESFCLFPRAGPPDMPGDRPLPEGCRWLPELKKRFGWKTYDDAQNPTNAVEALAIRAAQEQVVRTHWFGCLARQDARAAADEALRAVIEGDAPRARGGLAASEASADDYYVLIKTAPVLAALGDRTKALERYRQITEIGATFWGLADDVARTDLEKVPENAIAVADRDAILRVLDSLQR